MSDTCTPGLISDCWDGLLHKHHPSLSNKSQFCIALQLFYDGMGTTNSLHNQSSLCNVGVFYFIIKNLPNVVNSCFSNVHLVSLCYSQDLKTYGFCAVLSKLVKEIKHLSETGFAGSSPVLGMRTVYVSLVLVAGDNLALNSLLGFIDHSVLIISAQCAMQLKPIFSSNSIKLKLSCVLLLHTLMMSQMLPAVTDI